MEDNTLRNITANLFGRPVDDVLAGYLDSYASEIKASCETVWTISRELPADQAPAPVFSLEEK